MHSPDCAPADDARKNVRERETDAELLRRCSAEQDESSFEVLFRRYQPALLRYLQRYLGNLEDAETACQQTFLNIWRKADTFDAARGFQPWLYAVATHAAIDIQRGRKRIKAVSLGTLQTGMHDPENNLPPVPDPLPLDRMITGEEVAVLHQEIGDLSPKLRRRITLVDLEGMNYAQAAELLDEPIGTIKSGLHAARTQLRMRVRERIDGSPCTT